MQKKLYVTSHAFNYLKRLTFSQYRNRNIRNYINTRVVVLGEVLISKLHSAFLRANTIYTAQFILTEKLRFAYCFKLNHISQYKNHTSAMTPLNPKELDIIKKQLHVPSLNEIKDVLQEGLAKNFDEAQVEIVDCPDLTAEPFTLAAPGLNGNGTLLSIGGPSYLLPSVQRNKLYDIKQLLNHLQYSTDSLVIGAGAGPWPYLNRNCELIMNMKVSPAGVENETRVASVDTKSGDCVLHNLPNKETRLGFMADLFVSEGKPGQVLKVHAKKRTGSDHFTACIQKAIEQHYKNNLVGLGGVFLMRDGKIKQHVMQDFSTTPINTEAQLNNWLRFYNMSTPLVAVGTFVSSESDVDLRVQHFHSFSNHGEGGHYHIDTTPETIEYLGYFNLGATLYRVDQPETVWQFEKDSSISSHD